MAQCPYCSYQTPEPDDGSRDVQIWQEIGHMNSEHPDIIRERLASAGLLDMSTRFGEDDK
jgi:hypothetical protein